MSSYEIFRRLHEGPSPLRLPNAWDAGSARLFESMGASAIATTSAGVAWAQGYPDGGRLPAEVALQVAASMARVLTAPLSIDMENGYSDDPAAVAGMARRLIDLGVAGINIEDGTNAPALLAAKIEAIKNAAAKSGSNLFVNARTDVYLAGLVDGPKRVGETLARGAVYREAGADGLFVPGVVAPEDIAAIVEGAGLPINVLAWPGLAPADALGKLGVRRLSAGSGISQMLWGQAEELAKDFIQAGRSESMAEGAMSYARIQALFVGA
ncbi:PEP phosphonomutase [Frateuria sp. Soil773]|uniref:isocitrate lyase/PEP mutase family protein n=1 Tax=Frateuria sp. Soil773 TaxID=1736407 RepID=UPI0006FDBA84|nr:isocitrate lyase/phosphoenolpyruvate mutase family protein [Frateuria sp. Soil773]KRE92474.1 PEP phosphonomutase [Frateuria sp. Soil773]